MKHWMRSAARIVAMWIPQVRDYVHRHRTAMAELAQWHNQYGRATFAGDTSDAGDTQPGQRNQATLRDGIVRGTVERPNYAYGMLRAADLAKALGHASITVVEFGVATGNGLLCMVEHARKIEAETGVFVRVVGFDTGSGLPPTTGYKNHPELWREGDFSMEDQKRLLAKLDGRAELILGDIKDTILPFADALDGSSPIGFVSIDTDIYSGAKDALRGFSKAPECYLPAVSMYFDDVGSFFSNQWCGELVAIEEFNQENSLRKIDNDRSLRYRPVPYMPWYDHMYVLHVLDHPIRNRGIERNALSLEEHYAYYAKTLG